MYNLSRLDNRGLKEYMTTLGKDGRFNKGKLTEAARLVYRQQCELKKDGFCWRDKRFSMVNHALNFHMETVLWWSISQGPHVKL